MFENNLFYLLLIMQCLLVSWYLPSLLYQRMRRVITEYPPSEYPLLYPRPEEEYHGFHAKFRVSNQILLGLGLAVVAAAMFSKANLLADGWAMLPWGMFMIQMIPIMVVEISERSHAKMLRAKHKRNVRVAGIQSRGLTELISTPLFCIWLTALAGSIWIAAWTDGYALTPGDSALTMIVIVLLSNVAGFWYVRKLTVGKKIDPYQDPEDKFKACKAMATGLIYVSIGVSLFMAASLLIDFYEVHRLEPAAMSVYCQLIAFFSITTNLKGLKLEDVNFDVYKEPQQEAAH